MTQEPQTPDLTITPRLKNRFGFILIKLFFTFISFAVLNNIAMASTKVSHGTLMFGDQIDRTHITHLTDLPDIEKFKIEGTFFDLGWAHTRTRFFTFPLWGSADGNYVLYFKNGYGWKYLNISLKQAERYVKDTDQELFQLPHVQTYHNFMGTILFLGFIIIIVSLMIVRLHLRRVKPEITEESLKVLTIDKLNSFEENAKIRRNISHFREKR